jgi:hypothetical protein
MAAPGAKWFADMLLSSKGCVPGMWQGGGCSATKADCEAAFRTQSRSGRYPYLHRGSSAYTLYVQELYKRIHMEDA